MCGDRYCNDMTHRLLIDKMYSDIVLALSQAASMGGGSERGQSKRRPKTIVGWNKHVGDSHGRARECFQEWMRCGRPTDGLIYEKMCESKKIFKSRLRWCQNHQEQLKMDILANIITRISVVFGNTQIA